jgi:cation-transporting ATPase F
MAVLQIALTYWAPLNAAFATAPIGSADWGRIAVVAIIAFIIIEAEKRWRASMAC